MNDRPTSDQQTTDTDRPTPAATQTQTQSVREATYGDTGSSDVSDVRDTTSTGFLPEDRMEALRDRWADVQAGFVDDPRNAVQKAQQLVDDLVKELTDVFTRERTTLEGQWSGGGDADTEALRVALQRYRDFFNRLLGTR